MRAPHSAKAAFGIPAASVYAITGLMAAILACMTAGCSSPERVLDFSKCPEQPPTPKNTQLLRMNLPEQVSIQTVGEKGSVWRMDVKNPEDGETRQHWLVLYPDGKCLLSPRGWIGAEWGTDISQQNRENRLRIFQRHRLIVDGRSAALLQESFNDLVNGNYYRAPMLGRFSTHHGTIEINGLEQDPNERGGSFFTEPVDYTSVSRLVFVQAGENWVLDQNRSKTIWRTKDRTTCNFFGTDEPAMKSLRDKDVVLRKIEGFIPPALPEGWDW